MKPNNRSASLFNQNFNQSYFTEEDEERQVDLILLANGIKAVSIQQSVRYAHFLNVTVNELPLPNESAYKIDNKLHVVSTSYDVPRNVNGWSFAPSKVP